MKTHPMEKGELAKAGERILAENLDEVAAELRLVNVLDLIGYVRGERSAMLEDLVNSATELYFKPGAVRYAWSAELDVLWEVLPSVSLNMEFRWRGATAFFRLRLDSDHAAIVLQHISLEDGDDGENAVKRFAGAVADARRQPRRQRRRRDGLFPFVSL
jgi:hypothetical protein